MLLSFAISFALFAHHAIMQHFAVMPQLSSIQLMAHCVCVCVEWLGALLVCLYIYVYMVDICDAFMAILRPLCQLLLIHALMGALIKPSFVI